MIHWFQAEIKQCVTFTHVVTSLFTIFKLALIELVWSTPQKTGTGGKTASLVETAEGSPRYLWPREEKQSLWDSAALSYMCNSENQLSELCLLPWSPDRNTQGESESTTALPPDPASSKFPFSSPHPPPNPLYFLRPQRLAHLSPAAGALWRRGERSVHVQHWHSVPFPFLCTMCSAPNSRETKFVTIADERNEAFSS